MTALADNRLNQRMSSLKIHNKKALIPYITAGDPHPDQTVSLMHALVSAGADVLELGVPFSDPMADGPVIQLACERALKAGTTLTKVLNLVADFRKTDSDTPVVLMGYLNPIEIMGLDAFIQRATTAGVDGVLLVDLAIEEGEETANKLKHAGLSPIFLLAPTSSDARIADAIKLADGYIYYVSLKGVTGSSNIDLDDVATHLNRIRSATDIPLAVGFGIRDAQTAAAVSKLADGVIVGSSLVSEIADAEQPLDSLAARLAAKLSPMRLAMDSSK